MASSSPEDVHVLLVDDDRTCRTLVAGMLKKCNYQGEPRESPRARVDAKNHVTSLQSVDVVFPPRWTPPRARPNGVPTDPPIPKRISQSIAVTTASSGEEAMALLERGTQFNLLLTDVMMPDVDGPTLCTTLATTPSTRRCRWS